MSTKSKQQAERRTTPCRAALAAAIALAIAGVLASSAQAAHPSFSVEQVDAPTSKPYFVFDGRPGTEIFGRIRVVNTGTSGGTAKLYPVDATTGPTTGAVYRDARNPRRAVGAWMSLKAPSVELGRGESREIGFRVRVPKDATAGQHLGGIVAENATLRRAGTPRRDKGRFRINVRSRTVMAVQVSLPGRKIAGMAIGAVKQGGSQGGFQAIDVNLSSSGNYLLKPSLALTVMGPSGKVVVQSPDQKLDTFVPKTAIDFPVPVRGRALGAGKYTAYVTLRYAGRTVKAVRSFEITKKEVRQIFGSKAPEAQQDGGSIMRYLPWGLLALAAGAAGLHTISKRRGREHSAPARSNGLVSAGPSPGPASGGYASPVPANGGHAAPVPSPVPANGGHASPCPPPIPANRRGTSPRGAGQLVDPLEQPWAKWMLSVIADGVLSGRGASARDLCARAGNGITQRHLEHWSHQIMVACDQLGTARPFKQLDAPPFGMIYQMEPEVARQIRAALNGNGQHPSSNVAAPAAD